MHKPAEKLYDLPLTREMRYKVETAFIELGRAGGDMSDSIYRKAWEELRKVLDSQKPS